jgi:hypothetical protein
MVQAMERYPEAGVGLASSVIDEMQPFPIFTPPRQAYFKHFLQHGFMTCGPSGSIIRSDVFKEIGGFGAECYVGSDTILWLKLSALYPVVKFPPALIWWRQHEAQEYKSKQTPLDYLRNNYLYNKAILLSQGNPLSTEEKQEALRLCVKRHITDLVKLLLRGNISLSISLARESNLSLRDVLKSVPQNKYKFNTTGITY